MVQQVNVGSSANAGDGDVLRAAFIKINAGLLEAEASAGIATGARDQAVAAASSAAIDATTAENRATDAENARDSALAAYAATGPFRVYLTNAAAVADLAAISANGFVEIEADEAISGSPRTRYQKVGGSLVFVLSLDKYSITSLTNTKAYKIGPFLDQVKTKPCRILTLGTSIASFATSALQIIPEQIANTYGRNLSVIVNLGVLGGNYLPTAGHKKQVFGGASFNRLVMESGEADLEFSGIVDSIILVYGKESTGGAFDVYIDGVFDRSVSSNGAQAYNQESIFTFATRGFHKITIKAPASGIAFLERVELLQDDAGVYLENGCLGGSGLWNTQGLLPDGVGNQPGIAISGLVGVDAIFARTGATKPDIILMQHFTNDGPAHLTEFNTAIARAVTKTKDGAVPLVLCTEMPGMSFLTMAGTMGTVAQIGGNSRVPIRDKILSYLNEKHVAVMDWTEMVDYSNYAAYEAKYFPGVDKTHPTDDGHAVFTASLCDLFSVPHPGRKNNNDVIGDTLRANHVLPQLQANDDPYGFRFVRPSGIRLQAQDEIHDPTMQIIGQALTPVQKYVSVVQSAKVPNLVVKSYFDAILAASTSDEYGKFLRLTSTNQTFCLFGPFVATTIDQIFTVVLQVKRSNPANGSSIRVTTPFDNRTPRLLAGDDVFTSADIAFQAGANFLSDAPQFVSFQIKANSLTTLGTLMSLFGTNLDIYGMWITEGKQAVVTPRFKDLYGGLGTPMYMIGDETIDRVLLGQTYLESINSVTVEKVALDGFCYKPLSATLHRIYEMRNKGSIAFNRLLPVSPGSLSYNAKMRGQGAASASGWGNVSPFVTVPYGKRFTAMVRSPNNSSLRIYFYQGGNNASTYLKPDGTWASTAGASPPILTASATHFGELINQAVSFDMPDSSFATALGSSPTFNLWLSGGASAWTPATLVEGNSACVSATA